MVDISMCAEKACPKAKICYRFIAKPSEWQSYLTPNKTGGECELFIMAKSKSEIRRLDILCSGGEKDV